MSFPREVGGGGGGSRIPSLLLRVVDPSGIHSMKLHHCCGWWVLSWPQKPRECRVGWTWATIQCIVQIHLNNYSLSL